jgi:hypothetical protein
LTLADRQGIRAIEMAMAFVRVLFTALIALSVASLPVASAAARTAAPAEMSMPDGDHDCCPNAVQPCDMTKDGCMSMAACGLLTSTISEPAVFAIAFPLIAASVLPLPVSDVLDSGASGPPLHPPQI